MKKKRCKHDWVGDWQGWRCRKCGKPKGRDIGFDSEYNQKMGKLFDKILRSKFKRRFKQMARRSAHAIRIDKSKKQKKNRWKLLQIVLMIEEGGFNLKRKNLKEF